MQPFKVDRFVYEAKRLTMMEIKAKATPGVATEQECNKTKEYFKKMAELCRKTRIMEVSTQYAEKSADWLGRARKHSEIGERVAAFRDRIEEELKLKHFISLTADEVEHYRDFRKGWEHIIERFVDTLGDIEEARKCFALERYAAAIFHSLQIVEIGLIELGRFIRVKDPQPGWDATCNELNRILKKKYGDLDQFERDHRAFLEQILATIEAMKTAWRNKISHADNKLRLLGTDFSPEISREILYATRSFMSRLAEGCPKTGGDRN